MENTVKHDDINALAHLARININDDLLDNVTDNINSILGLVDQLQQANTDGVEPMYHPLDATQRLRADEVTETNNREALQANAPAIEAGLFLVPQVIE
ncbi:MAG: aspartyl-tRNA(Asn)/glutamyl-tRNA(Gln) amidotransferase subunit C [Candidatus Endobugula sp.]|jgi:aspartyl-tRNA(Asn)/glutamyl-tRNA(Gln) amidotransferase subunit C